MISTIHCAVPRGGSSPWFLCAFTVFTRAPFSRSFKVRALTSCMVATWLVMMALPIAAQEQAELSAEQLKQVLVQRDELWNTALQLLKEGKPVEARPLLEQALEIERRVLGPNHADVLSTLEVMADTLIQLMDFPAAIEARRQRLGALELTLPKGHWRLADSRWDLRDVELLADLTPEQRQALRRAVELNRQGMTAYQQYDLDAANYKFREALKIRQRLFKPPHPQLAVSYNNLGYFLQSQGEYAAAREYYERALAMRERLYPEDAYPGGHPDLAGSLNNLGYLLEPQGEYAAAREYYERALAMYERLYPEDAYPGGHPDLATSLNNLGSILDSQGEHAAAREYYERALAMYEHLYPEDAYPGGHPDLARSLNNLGSMLDSQGEHAAAREYYERALAMYERLYPEDAYPGGHPSLASSLNNLGVLLKSHGEYAAAREYCERALAMYERLYSEEAYPGGHPDLAGSLNNLGALFQSQGEYAAAREYHERALAMRERLFPKEAYPGGHPSLASSLNNLGALLKSQGEYAAAREYYKRGLAMYERLYPEDAYPGGHPDLAGSLNNLGMLFQSQGEHAAAREHYERGLAMYKRLYPEEAYPGGHPDLASSLSNLGVLEIRNGNSRAGFSRLSDAFWMDMHGVQNVFSGSSQQTMRSFLATSEGSFDSFLTAAWHLSEDDPDAADAALQGVLSRKTVVSNALLRFRLVERLQAENPEIATMGLDYRAVRQQLADLSVRPLGDETPEARAARLRELADQSNRLQVTLNRALSAATGAPPPLRVDFNEVRSHLSDDAAAIEFIRFDPFDFKATGDEPRLQPARYLAFVLGADTKESPRMIDLGEAEPIERAVAELREHIEAVTRRLRFFNEEGLEEIYRELAGELSGLVFAPLRDALGDARMIYLSPDGELNRIAFEALTAADGSYLIDHYEFAYASSSRDLLRASDKPATGTIVFASPDYDLNDQPAVPGENLLADVTRGAPDYWQGDLSRDTRGLSWDRLPATEGEASRVVEMFAMHDVYGPAHSFLGSDALEGLLKRMQAPRILHLATHGFYLADQQREHPEQSFLDRGLGASTTAADLGRLGKLENPLLRSGIVLAGANRLGEAGGETTETTDDGWVTAEEIGLLNLQGTELVVLSACETGLGDVRTGEGVAGLRRAFLQAGARTLVTSLYKVPDEATQALMIDFYSRLAAGESKLAALRGAQQATIAQRRKENGAAHPFFWASFVLVGDPE